MAPCWRADQSSLPDLIRQSMMWPRRAAREGAMKTVVVILGLLTVTPALGQTIAPADSPRYVGKSVTVEGTVNEVHHAASGKVTFIDMGGRYPNNTFAGVIFSDDASKFSDIDSLDGKTIDITGTIKLYQDRPEIILNDPAQIKTR
jgi:DNA/RNA endonuclease YhcR with UshA esterase domain